MRLYYFFGYLLRPFGLMGLWVFSHLTKTPRVRIVVRNEKDEILLVKSWLNRNAWSFPGGGISRHESPEAAAHRELGEETGIIAAKSHLAFVGAIHTWGHDELIYSLQTVSDSLPEKLPSPFEIQEAAWFRATALPKLNPYAEEIIEKVVVGQ